MPVVVVALWPPPKKLPPEEVVHEKLSWRSMCVSFTTNIVSWHSGMRRPDKVRRMSPGEFMLRANDPDCRPVMTSWAETNKIDAVMVELGGKEVVVDAPLDLDACREYWIVGPGVRSMKYRTGLPRASRKGSRAFDCRAFSFAVNGAGHGDADWLDTEKRMTKSRRHGRPDLMWHAILFRMA